MDTTLTKSLYQTISVISEKQIVEIFSNIRESPKYY